MNYREIIRQRIQDLGTTQRAVCKSVAVSEQSLSNFLNGSRTYSYALYAKTLNALGLTLGHQEDSIGTAPATSIHEIIKDEIDTRNMTLKALSNKCGVNRSSLSSFLSGRRGINVAAIERIIQELGLTFVSYGQPII